MNIKAVPFVAVLLGATMVSWSAEEATEAFQFKGNIQFHAEKALSDNNSDNALDKFYLRANVGGKYTVDNMVGEFNIRMYGPMYGVNAVSKVVLDTIVDENGDSVSVTKSVSTKSVADVQLDKALISYTISPSFIIRAGRWVTDYSVMSHFGNYIDVDPDSTKYFLSRVYMHDAVELFLQTGILSHSVLVGVTDKNCNTGYVRVVESLNIPQGKLGVDVGWRGNVLDSLSFPDADTKHYNRFFLRAKATIIPGLIPYFEVAMVDMVNSSGKLLEKQQGVGYIGLQVPTGLQNTQVNIEAQYQKDRKVGTEDRPIDWNLAVTQKLGKHTKLQMFAFSDLAAEKAYDLKVGTRLTMATP
ncbi:MAG TPA: hypothetical protein VLM37_00500 [Fibrobacteraceae bacterium]|nr:hypothetical protein [Fibrobacteraceae bacterium]